MSQVRPPPLAEMQTPRHPSLQSEAMNAIHTKEVRTKTHNTVDDFQLGHFCTGCVSPS